MTGDCFFFMLLRNPRNLSDGLSPMWAGGKGVRRDRRLHLLKSALGRCVPLAGVLWQWHLLGTVIGVAVKSEYCGAWRRVL